MDKHIEDLISDALEALSETQYEVVWDSALVKDVDGEVYHAITNSNDVVVRANDASRHSSWLCDYLEAVSPGNISILLAKLKAARADDKRHRQEE